MKVAMETGEDEVESAKALPETPYGTTRQPILVPISSTTVASRQKSILHTMFQKPKFFLAFISTLPLASAQNTTAVDCSFDQGTQDPGAAFPFRAWVNRGICVHHGSYAQCQANLMAALDGLDSIHATEYSASAGVLALLPTIGALFGTPTSEIWTLLTVIPFGGGLAITLSFGGTIMSTQLADYEGAFSKHTIYMGGNTKATSDPSYDDSDEDDDREALVSRSREMELAKLAKMSKRIVRRLRPEELSHLPRGVLAGSLSFMLLLFCVVQVGMGIVEAGAVYSNGCTYYWWFHIWYIAVTISTVLDNFAYLPFKSHRKLYLTSIPYDTEVAGGERITNDSSKSTSSPPIGLALKNLSTVKSGCLKIVGSRLETRHRNSILVLVSVARNTKDQSVWRIAFQVFTKITAVTVFVFGTCVLAAVSLLAMPMAQMVTMLIVAAGIGSRFIAAMIVSAVGKNEPMMHIITSNESDSIKVITEIFDLQQRESTKFQVELEGHIFVDGRRVAKRSLWWRRILGVMAKPFDLRKAKEYGLGDEDGLRKDARNVGRSDEGFRTYGGASDMELSRLQPDE